MSSRWQVGVVALVMAVATVVAPAGPSPVGAPDAGTGSLVITEDAILGHLEALQAIADAQGGNRALGSTGYKASVDYVTGELEAAGYAVTAEPVRLPDEPVKLGPGTFERTAPSGRTYTEGVDFNMPSPGASSAVSGDVAVVADGCDPTSFGSVPPGAVVLVGLDDVCGPLLPVIFASDATAGGLVLGPAAGPGAPPQHVDLGSFVIDLDLPVVSVSGDVADELEVLAGGTTVTVTIDTGWGLGTVTTTNVLAEWPGSTDEVVMVGAHLDSVPAGPGINDNGSGIAGILAIAEALAAADLPTDRTIRFGWWGAEEVGLVGSQAYVDSLSTAELDRLVAYLNVDMIGSPNWIRGVGDPAVASVSDTVSPGSAEITTRFESYFAELGLPTVPIWSDGRSDDGSFAEAGVPVGSLFTGVDTPKTAEELALFGGTQGAPLDPCYHQPCDTLANVDVPITAQNALALELAGVIDHRPGRMAPVLAAVPAEPVGAAPAFTG
jgi:aminopeptidase Y